jgi:CubicO group peptidase (beta-lactamase class C family)
MPPKLVSWLVVCTATLGAIADEKAAERMVFPGEDWEDAKPESQGIHSDKLEAAVQYLEDHAGADGVKRLVVIRNGRMIWKGPEADKQQRIWSVSKAFTSTAHGLLIEDGKCTLDTRAKDFSPRLAEHYPTVTLRHLATMTSGIDGVGGAYDFDAERRGDQNALVDPLPPFFAPGTKYMYWDEATQQYGYVLTRIAGESLHDYLKRRILDPIGITRFQWQLDANKKVLNWTGGIEISASDLARFGHLFLNGGNWSGKQLISASWVQEATKVQVPASVPAGHPTSNRQGSGVYGYHWWPNGITPDGKRRWPDAPAGTYARSGYNNNDLFVIPAWKMVIVRLGLDQREDEITTVEYNVFLRKVGEAILDPVVEGERRVWHPITIVFRGPAACESDDDPSPFLDYRLQVTFTGPSGQRYNVPGFFDGDGRGGGTGDVWRARFSPDESGRWTFQATFRAGKDVAVSLDRAAGEPAALDGAKGEFDIAARDPLNIGRMTNPPSDSRADGLTVPQQDGFLKWGRLEYVGGHYLKFRDGPYWIRGGTDSPENFLAYAGFDNTPPSHNYAAHVEDWRPGDADWGDRKGRGIIGAINYLASRHVNSVYFLTMNIGGDGGDVWPWVGSPKPRGSATNDNQHYDIGKLRQWETVFAHAQRKGIFLHFVFNEAEAPNKRELDDGELGTERKLYYREIIARFGHHLALEWNLCEEYNLQFDFGPDRIRAFADYINAVDPYGHAITVHSAGDPLEKLRFTFGDDRFALTSIQLNQRPIHEVTEAVRQATSRAGRALPASLDEFTVDRGQKQSHIPVDDADGHRRQKLWPTYLSGGMIEFILDELLETDSFKTPEREALWDYTWHARKFIQENLSFWQMHPADELATGAGTIKVGTGRGRSIQLGPQVLAKPGEVYAVYLPTASPSGTLDLSAAKGVFRQRWYNPRTGEFEGKTAAVAGGSRVSLGTPPSDADEDWAVLIAR